MKVLALLPGYPPKSLIGSFLTTHEYLAGLAARGHQVDVIVEMSSELHQPTYDLDGVHVHPATWDHYLPDLVVSHLGDFHKAARYAERVDRPSVRMVHGYDPQGAIKLDQTPTALAVFPSMALAKDIGWSQQCFIAHPPIFEEQYKTKPGRLVTLINLSPEKGGEILRHIATELPDTQFLAVKGWGRFQQVDQPPNVKIVDPVADARAIYSQTRILLMPSDYESYGRVAVEAACSGIPTIAHPSGGLLEAMGDAATWVDRDDLAGWVEKVRYLQDAGAWKEASRRSRRAVQRDPEATVTRVAEAIEQVAKVYA